MFAVIPKVSTRNSAWPASGTGIVDSATRQTRKSSRFTKKSGIGLIDTRWLRAPSQSKREFGAFCRLVSSRYVTSICRLRVDCHRKTGEAGAVHRGARGAAPGRRLGSGPGSLGAPFSIGVGLRHGPERLEDLYLPDPVLGSPYAYQFESTQEPAPTFSSTGDVPDGLGLDESGLLSGVPTKIGHYTFVALAENGVSEGTEQQANVEVVAPPVPVLEAPDLYAPTNAVLMGNVNPGNLPSQAWFEYWPSADPTPASTELLSLGVGTKPVEVVGKLADLAPTTEYSYRLAASNDASPAPVLSEVATFTTGLPRPSPVRASTSSRSRAR